MPFLYKLVKGSKKVFLQKSGNGKEITDLKTFNIKLKGFKNCFFGYYDVSPFNPKNENFIVFLVNSQNPYFEPSKKHPGYIVLYNLENDDYSILTECYVWNWQQGNRLQWFNENEIIFNDYAHKREKLVTKILNIHTDHCQIIDEPFQAVCKREYFLGLDYNALYKIRSEYAYQYLSAGAKSLNNVLKYDFKTSSFEEVVNVGEIRKLLKFKEPFKAKAEHINHLMIAPNGRIFIFIYRFVSGSRRHDFLLAYDFTTRSPRLLVENETISHCAWRNDDNVLFWGIVGGKKGYFNYNFDRHNTELIWPSDRDGHPSFAGFNTIITDTYPDRHSIQKLKKIDLEKGEETDLATIFHPPFFELHTRCDLHPSLSGSGRFIQVDTLTRKRREIIVFENGNE